MGVAQVVDADALESGLAGGGNTCASPEGVAGHRALTALSGGAGQQIVPPAAHPYGLVVAEGDVLVDGGEGDVLVDGEKVGSGVVL